MEIIVSIWVIILIEGKYQPYCVYDEIVHNNLFKENLQRNSYLTFLFYY